MQSSWLDGEIENWARWHQSALRWHRHCCGSLESCYRSPQPWDAPPLRVVGRINPLSAWAVERAWRGLSNKNKLLMKWHYVLRKSDSWIVRRLGRLGLSVAPALFHVELSYAKWQLGQLLDNRVEGVYEAIPVAQAA